MASTAGPDGAIGHDNAADDPGGTASGEMLDKRIQHLCQELQDKIFDFTFEAPATIHITDSFKPPLALSFDHERRERFAHEYYSSRVFQCTIHDCEELELFSKHHESLQEQHYFKAWMMSLSEAHRHKISHVQITIAEKLDCMLFMMNPDFLHWIGKTLMQVDMGHVHFTFVGGWRSQLEIEPSKWIAQYEKQRSED